MRTKYMTTKAAALMCGMKPGELTSFVKKYAVPVERLGKAYLWTHGDTDTVQKLATAFKGGECIHCGKPWDRPEQEEGAQDAEGGGE